MMSRLCRALLCLSLASAGIGAATPSAADDHARGDARQPGDARQQGPQGRPMGQARPQGPTHAPGPGGPGGPGTGFHPGPGPRPAFDGRGQLLDQRYNHGHFYPPMGSVSRSLPGGYRPYYRGGDAYYFSGGIWYAPRGPEFVVVLPPPGLVVNVLPPYYSTVWLGGNPYYYADNVYYTWQPDQNGYAVVDPPEDADQPTPPPESAAPGVEDLIVYPKNGQTKDQQAADQFECHRWARNQTGFDPTLPAGGVQGDVERSRSNYTRAMSACLQGRGYQVN